MPSQLLNMSCQFKYRELQFTNEPKLPMNSATPSMSSILFSPAWAQGMASHLGSGFDLQTPNHAILLRLSSFRFRLRVRTRGRWYPAM